MKSIILITIRWIILTLVKTDYIFKSLKIYKKIIDNLERLEIYSLNNK